MWVPNRYVKKVFAKHNMPTENVDNAINDILLTRSAGGVTYSSKFRHSYLTPGIKPSCSEK
jgi:hypothetical protein